MLSCPGPFLQEQSSSESSSSDSPTAAEKQTVVMKQKDVANSVSGKTEQRPSPGVFIKLNLPQRVYASLLALCQEVEGRGFVSINLISWLLLLLEGSTLTGNTLLDLISAQHVLTYWRNPQSLWAGVILVQLFFLFNHFSWGLLSTPKTQSISNVKGITSY